MTLLLPIVVALVLAFLAFKFVKGMIKLAVLAIILIAAVWFASGGLHGMAVR